MSSNRRVQSCVGMSFALVISVVAANSLIGASAQDAASTTQQKQDAKKKAKVCSECLKDNHAKEVRPSDMNAAAADAPGSPITVLADKNGSYIIPGIILGDGHELKVDLNVPAGRKIVSLDKFQCDTSKVCNYDCTSTGCGWTHQVEVTRLADNHWAWIGWSNSGQNCQLRFVVHYQ
jgi:hypothetical protein